MIPKKSTAYICTIYPGLVQGLSSNVDYLSIYHLSIYLDSIYNRVVRSQKRTHFYFPIWILIYYSLALIGYKPLYV